MKPHDDCTTFCWMCDFANRKQRGRVERHHIAGRGHEHDVPENFAYLCRDCHRTIQSRSSSEIICLVLKRLYDITHFNPATICELRGWDTSWITEVDVLRCHQIMKLMLLLYRQPEFESLF